MTALLAGIGSLVGSILFGWAGSLIGPVTGFLLGTVGGGVGLYYGRKWSPR